MNSKPYVVLVGMDFSELADRALPADTHTSRGALPRVIHVSAP
jgi:hypothetical protein